MLRIPLAGNDHSPEAVRMDNGIYGARAIAADNVRNKLVVNNAWNGDLATVNPNGSGYQVIATMSGGSPNYVNRLAVVVDEAEGRVYWNEIYSNYLTSIKSAKLDGSNVITHVASILNQDGLALDTVRRKLLWVALIWNSWQIWTPINLTGWTICNERASPIALSAIPSRT